MKENKLKLKFDPRLDLRIDAINSVVDLCKSQTRRHPHYIVQTKVGSGLIRSEQIEMQDKCAG